MIYAIVMLIVLPAAAFAFGLCRTAAKPVPQICTRRAPHKCAVNGFAKRGTYANGRPTMPSQPEPEDEFKRRTR